MKKLLLLSILAGMAAAAVWTLTRPGATAPGVPAQEWADGDDGTATPVPPTVPAKPSPGETLTEAEPVETMPPPMAPRRTPPAPAVEPDESPREAPPAAPAPEPAFPKMNLRHEAAEAKGAFDDAYSRLDALQKNRKQP